MEDYFAWVSWAQKIVSFRLEEGFEAIRFASHEEWLAFVVDKIRYGFRIQ